MDNKDQQTPAPGGGKKEQRDSPNEYAMLYPMAKQAWDMKGLLLRAPTEKTVDIHKTEEPVVQGGRITFPDRSNLAYDPVKLAQGIFAGDYISEDEVRIYYAHDSQSGLRKTTFTASLDEAVKLLEFCAQQEGWSQKAIDGALTHINVGLTYFGEQLEEDHRRDVSYAVQEIFNRRKKEQADQQPKQRMPERYSKVVDEKDLPSGVEYKVPYAGEKVELALGKGGDVLEIVSASEMKGLAKELGLKVPDSILAFIVQKDVFIQSRGARGSKALRLGEQVQLGRAHLKERFEFSEAVSRNHLGVKIDEDNGKLALSLKDTSTNGTSLIIEYTQELPATDRTDSVPTGESHSIEENSKKILDTLGLDTVIKNTRPEAIELVVTSYKEGVAAINRDPSLSPQDRLQRQYALLKIALEGKLGDIELPDPFSLPGRAKIEDYLSYRKELMEIYAKNHNLDEALVKQNIIGGHGSKSASLLGVIEHGLRPLDTLKELGIQPVAGEVVMGGEYNDKYVSFAQWNDTKTLLKYGIENAKPLTVEGLQLRITALKGKEEEQIKNVELIESESRNPSRNPEQMQGVLSQQRADLEQIRIKQAALQHTIQLLTSEPTSERGRLEKQLTQENFPVLYFTDGDGYTQDSVHIMKGGDIQSEFGLRNGADVNIILVPRGKVPFVQSLVEQQGKQAQVFPIEDYA